MEAYNLPINKQPYAQHTLSLTRKNFNEWSTDKTLASKTVIDKLIVGFIGETLKKRLAGKTLTNR